jgi:hypothetical protein
LCLELLADELRADEPAVGVDLLAVGVTGKGELADAGDRQRVDHSEQDRHHDHGEAGSDRVSFEVHVSRDGE